MCGIAGILHRDQRPVEKRLLLGMADCLAHRGPDGAGIFCEKQIGFAHRRLKIIDLTDAAHQPMSLPGRKVTIVYNGEIYNYLELRKELLHLGYTFFSHSDTEVILNAYCHWGVQCLEKFNGMFSFALWDAHNQQLFCARDRFGIRPFYYFFNARTFVFASEIKAILLYPEVSRRVAEPQVFDFLRWGMLDHVEGSFFEHIVSLPAAHYLLISEQSVKKKRYWDFTISGILQAKGDFRERFREEFRRAVRWHLRSDVPVGFLLSGGLDSSAIVCTANDVERNTNTPFGQRYRTFSSYFPFSQLDESPFIRAVLEKTGISGRFISPKPENFLSELDELIYHQEEPFGGLSIYAQWCLMREVHRCGLKVVLDGQGADEQLAGYRKFYYFYLQELFRRGKWLLGAKETAYFFSSISFLIDLQFRQAVLRYFASPALTALFRPDFYARFRHRALPLRYTGDLTERIKLDLTRFSLPVLLRHEDRNSMAFSVEARVPFLDHQFVEFLASLPLAEKIHSGWTKYVMRKALVGIFPRQIQLRKSKLGFQAPEDLWFRQVLLEPVAKTFQNARFLPRFVAQKKLLEEFRSDFQGRFNLRPASVYFRFFILEHWARVFRVV